MRGTGRGMGYPEETRGVFHSAELVPPLHSVLQVLAWAEG